MSKVRPHANFRHAATKFLASYHIELPCSGHINMNHIPQNLAYKVSLSLTDKGQSPLKDNAVESRRLERRIQSTIHFVSGRILYYCYKYLWSKLL